MRACALIRDAHKSIFGSPRQVSSLWAGVQVKSEVSYGCNEPSIIHCTPSSLLRILHSYILEIQSMYCIINTPLSISIKYYQHWLGVWYMITLNGLLQCNMKKKMLCNINTQPQQLNAKHYSCQIIWSILKVHELVILKHEQFCSKRDTYYGGKLAPFFLWQKWLLDWI